MKAEMILQANVLDIIFDNRNKEYGAYELRSHYESRMRKSVLIIFLFLSICCLIYYLAGKNSSGVIHSRLYSPEDVSLTQVNINKPIVQPKIPQPQHRQIATIQNTKYLIVPDKAATNPPPPVDQLDINKIDIETKPGDLIGEITPTPSENKGNGTSATTQPMTEKEVVRDHADIMPEFPGGREALQRFLSRNLKMPREDLEPGSSISTLVRFVVDKDGRVAGIELEKSGGRDFDNEVIRVIKKMPTWVPGKQNGRNVAVYFKLPVIFTVPDEN
jgi:protein TonB